MACHGVWEKTGTLVEDISTGSSYSSLITRLKAPIRTPARQQTRGPACAGGVIRMVNIEKGELVASISDALDPSDFAWKASVGMFNHDGSQFILRTTAGWPECRNVQGEHVYSVA